MSGDVPQDLYTLFCALRDERNKRLGEAEPGLAHTERKALELAVFTHFSQLVGRDEFEHHMLAVLGEGAADQFKRNEQDRYESQAVRYIHMGWAQFFAAMLLDRPGNAKAQEGVAP